MITMRSRATRTRYDLKLCFAVSIFIALLMASVSIAGLVDWGRVYPGASLELLPLFVGQDALNLVVGLTILLGALWLARGASLIGLLLWPGALFYVLYDYGFYVLGAPFTVFFLPYIALMTLSAYTMIAVIASIDAQAVRVEIERRIPARLVGGFLAGIALLFTALWAGMTVTALANGTELATVPRVVTILDLTIQLPALFVGGVLLIRRHALGYVVATGLLLQAAAYLIGLSALAVLQQLLMGTAFDPVAVVPGIVVGAFALAAIGPFVRVSVGQSIGRTALAENTTPTEPLVRGVTS